MLLLNETGNEMHLEENPSPPTPGKIIVIYNIIYNIIVVKSSLIIFAGTCKSSLGVLMFHVGSQNDFFNETICMTNISTPKSKSKNLA